ncbi:glycosyltransferase family 4 protein [Flavisolibacter ginsengisoli]|jgi:glycosyltransferase involved in cell wall biosynthesis|nr:glycosyltransferase family 4 protein [Flavisolibacter ginsengisoli]
MKTKKPIILHTIDSLSVGGAEILLNNTIKLLPEFDHIVVYLFKQNELKLSILEDGVELICLEYKGWSNLLPVVLKLKKTIQEKKPFLVHSHLFYSTICTRLAVPSSVPLVSTLHSLYSKDAFEKNIQSIWAERFLLKKKHALIAVSKFVLDDYLLHIPFSGKRYVLYNFLPDNMFNLKTYIESSIPIKCVALGNLKEAKNYRYLLEIFKCLKNLNVSLDIYGVGTEENELAEMITSNALNVKLCGAANNIVEILQSYDLFIQASSHEGFGISVIEAMAVGVPVILSDIPVFREITQNRAQFFPLDDACKAAEIIKEVMGNMERNQAIALKAYDFALMNYSSKKYKEQLLHIYEDITRQKLINECAA